MINRDSHPFNFMPLVVLAFSKKHLIIANLIFIILFALVYSFFIAKSEYEATLTFFPPQTSFSEMTQQFSEMFSVNQLSYEIMNEQIFSLFESKVIKRKIIEKFNLYDKYKLSKRRNKFLHAERKLQRDLFLDVNEKGYMSYSKMLAFTIYGYSTDPDTAKLLVEYVFMLLDSSIKSISTDRARRNRSYIEKQVRNNKKRLYELQDSMKAFQKQNKAIHFQEQLMYSIQTYSNISMMLEQKELLLKNLKETFSSDVPELREIQNAIDVYKKKLYEMEHDTLPHILPGLEQYSKIFPEYFNLLREIEVMQHFVKYLMTALEHARLQEAKSVSHLIITDDPFTPEYKSRPKRLVLTLKIVFVYMLLLFLLLFVQEIYITRKR